MFFLFIIVKIFFIILTWINSVRLKLSHSFYFSSKFKSKLHSFFSFSSSLSFPLQLQMRFKDSFLPNVTTYTTLSPSSPYHDCILFETYETVFSLSLSLKAATILLPNQNPKNPFLILVESTLIKLRFFLILHPAWSNHIEKSFARWNNNRRTYFAAFWFCLCFCDIDESSGLIKFSSSSKFRLDKNIRVVALRQQQHQQQSHDRAEQICGQPRRNRLHFLYLRCHEGDHYRLLLLLLL